MSEYGKLQDQETIRFERVLPGPVERVWSYLTDSEKRGTWLAQGPMDLRQGGRVELVFRNSELSERAEAVPARYRRYEGESMAGEVTECEPPHRLSFTWSEADGAPSEVSFELTPAAGGEVVLVLTHRRLANRTALLSVASGWHTHLDVLSDRLRGSDPDPFWSAFAVMESAYDERIPAS